MTKARARLTARGLVVDAAITLSCYAGAQYTLEWEDERGNQSWSHVPGQLPAISMDAGELKHSFDPILLDYTPKEPKPRWFGTYQRGWWNVENAVIDFSTAEYGAHVVWLEEYLQWHPDPVCCGGYFDPTHFICGGSHDVNFDGRTDVFDFLSLVEWVQQQDVRGDWNEDGTCDFFDFLEFMEGW